MKIMKIHFNRISSFILAITLAFTLAVGAFGLCGCGKKSGSNNYLVYYVNPSGTALVAASVTIDVTDVTDKSTGTSGADGANGDSGTAGTGVAGTAGSARTKAQIEKLLDAMNNPGKKGKYVAAKPENVVLERWTVDGNNLYIYYTASYKEMPAATEVLYRAAVVKTVSQAEGIEHVTFYVDNAPATYANGNVIGMMSASDFIDDADGKSGDMTWCDLKLYFANVKGNKLMPMTVSVAYNKNVPVERVIVEQLIKGPAASGYYRTLPESVKLLGISVTDGTCYVNLDSAFMNEMVNTSEAIPVYSIVNSLCELDTVNQVQILVNGESNKMYRESVSLETKFTKNDEIVQLPSSQTQPATQPSNQLSNQLSTQPATRTVIRPSN